MSASTDLRRPALGLLLCALLATPAAAGYHWSTSSGDVDPNDAEWLMSGTWSAGRDLDRDDWWIHLRNETPRGGRSEQGWKFDESAIEGLDLKTLGKGRVPVDFKIRRDAGAIVANGVFSGAKGAGTFELELDPAFATALEKRGVGKPSRVQHAQLLLGGANFSLLDALQRERYATPRVEMLVRMTHHGVRESFVTGLAKAGYRLESLDELVRAVDHGVNPQFVQEMASLGYRNLDFETLMRARDHGATAAFVQDLEEAGFKGLTLDQVIRARDHGIDGGFVESLRRAGFERLTLEDAIRARDHGVTSGYARRMREKRPDLTLAEVIQLRDRGVKP